MVGQGRCFERMQKEMKCIIEDVGTAFLGGGWMYNMKPDVEDIL